MSPSQPSAPSDQWLEPYLKAHRVNVKGDGACVPAALFICKNGTWMKPRCDCCGCHLTTRSERQDEESGTDRMRDELLDATLRYKICAAKGAATPRTAAWTSREQYCEHRRATDGRQPHLDSTAFKAFALLHGPVEVYCLPFDEHGFCTK